MNTGERDVLSEEEPGISRFSTFVSILIALVSVLGALLAWRVAVASSGASSADTRGLLSELDHADVVFQASITVLGHETAYAAALTNDALADAFDSLDATYQPMASAFRSAASRSRDFMSQNNFVNRDGTYNVAGEMAKAEADSVMTLNRDTNPLPQYKAADRARTRALWLLGDLIWFSGALVALTLADAIHHPSRYFFLFAGIGILFTGSLAAVIIEGLIQ